MPETLSGRSALTRKKKSKRLLFAGGMIFLLLAALFLVLLFAGGEEPNFLQALFKGLTGATKEVEITLPAVLFAGSDIDESLARTLETGGVLEAALNEDGSVTYRASLQTLNEMAEEAKYSLLAKAAELEEGQRHPYIKSVEYDEELTEFTVRFDAPGEQYIFARAASIELFLLAVKYHYLLNEENSYNKVQLELAKYGTGVIVDTMLYPEALERAPELLRQGREQERVLAGPQPGDRVVVSTGPDNLNLRNGPGITYLIIDILSSGTELEVTGKEGEWLEVQTPDLKEGWVHGDYVEFK